MTAKDDMTEMIERYLDGEMPSEEQQSFRDQMNNDPDLTREIDFQKELRAELKDFGAIEALTSQLDDFHAEMNSPEEEKEERSSDSKSGGGRVVPMRVMYGMVSVAAAIAVLISVGTMQFLTTMEGDVASPENPYEELVGPAHDIAPAATSMGAEEVGEGTDVMEDDVPPVGKEVFATTFVISESGYLVTNYHAVDMAQEIFVEVVDDSTINYRATVIARDSDLDIALLKITDERFEKFDRLPFMFGKKGAKLGEDVYTLGYPREDIVYGSGDISAVSGFQGDTLEYQVSVPVNPGNSGGPLLNKRGEVVGIVTARNTQEDGAAYATKAEYFVEFVNSLEEQLEEEPIKLSRRNSIKNKRRPDQIGVLENFVLRLTVRR